jgi:hypothetical protein
VACALSALGEDQRAATRKQDRRNTADNTFRPDSSQVKIKPGKATKVPLRLTNWQISMYHDSSVELPLSYILMGKSSQLAKILKILNNGHSDFNDVPKSRNW